MQLLFLLQTYHRYARVRQTWVYVDGNTAPGGGLAGSVKRRHGYVLLLAILILAWPAVCHAEKTDTVILKNGDKITGEVKSLSRGKLDYSTDDAGRLAIEWVKIARITSPHSFEVEMSSGAKYFGRLGAVGRDGILAVEGWRADTLVISSVVRVNAIDAKLFQRMKAYLDVGFTFAKANQATTFNTAGEAAYRGTKFGGTLAFESYAQGQESTPTTSRNTISLQATRFLPKRWSAIALAQTEQNDELDLDYRVTVAAVAGRVLVQSNSSDVGVGGGLAVTREQFKPGDGDTLGPEDPETNLEGLVAASWDAFRFDSPKLDFSTTLYLYPSISTPGRVRGQFSTRLKYELFADFNAGISLTDTFDSRPPDETATKNDYIMSFTIGWSYRR